MAKRELKPHEVITGEVRLSYVHIWEAHAVKDGETPKYSAQLIIPKTDTVTIAAVNEAIQAAYNDGKDKLKGKSTAAPALETLKTPLRDGDLEKPDDEDYAGAYFMNANSSDPVGVVDRANVKITDRSQIYSGVYAKAFVGFFAYNTNGGKGIACGLNHVQKLRDGTPLGGKGNAEDVFDVEEVDDDDVIF